jgi:hypothetical protein
MNEDGLFLELRCSDENRVRRDIVLTMKSGRSQSSNELYQEE